MCQADRIDIVRSSFLSAARRATELLGRRELAEHWGDESVLAEFSVAGLAGHLLRSIKTVELYLDGTEPDAGKETVSAPGYYAVLRLPPDITAPVNLAIRKRGEESAAGGPASVSEEARSLVDRLSDRLCVERADRRMVVAGDQTITLDDYLRTRIVELLVHCDDLASSIGIADMAEPEQTAASVAIETLVSVGRLQFGDLAVLRALTRREQDDVEALRVL